MKHLLLSIIGLLLFGLANNAPVQAQSQPIPESPRQYPKTSLEKAREIEGYERDRARKEIEDIRKQNNPLNIGLPKSKMEYSENSLTSAQKKLLEPAPEDYKTFADFLRQPDTGLIRLMPKGKYAYNGTVSASDPKMDKTLPIPGAGAFYSFTKKTHVLSPNSDIYLADDVFYSGFVGDVLGLVVLLGDVPLESVNSNTRGVDTLAGFAPPPYGAAMEEQKEKNAAGFKVGNHSFRSTLIALPDATYALRSTAYDRSDVLIAFRVVRQDNDGSLIILWKKLQEFKTGKPK